MKKTSNWNFKLLLSDVIVVVFIRKTVRTSTCWRIGSSHKKDALSRISIHFVVYLWERSPLHRRMRIWFHCYMTIDYCVFENDVLLEMSNKIYFVNSFRCNTHAQRDCWDGPLKIYYFVDRFPFSRQKNAIKIEANVIRLFRVCFIEKKVVMVTTALLQYEISCIVGCILWILMIACCLLYT